MTSTDYEADSAEVAAILDADIDDEDRADPTLLYIRATQLRARYDAVCAELETVRAQAVQQMSADGMSYRQIAAHVGLSVPRVQQMVKRQN